MKPKRLSLSREARKEILDTAGWYDRQRPGLGDEFVDAVDEAFRRVVRMGPDCRPARGVSPELDVKRVLVHRFPYLVIFIELPRSVRVLAVSHGRRRPGYWRKRM